MIVQPREHGYVRPYHRRADRKRSKPSAANSVMKHAQPRYVTILRRALRLRCPRCGRGILFSGWFQMRQECDWCGLRYEREPGFYLGSIYINYGLTGGLVAAISIVYFGLWRETIPKLAVFGPLAVFSLVFPLWFFRYARSLWLGFDQYWDPQDTTDDRP